MTLICKKYGFEYTGEFREPKIGEWAMTGSPPKPHKFEHETELKYKILKLTVLEEKKETP